MDSPVGHTCYPGKFCWENSNWQKFWKPDNTRCHAKEKIIASSEQLILPKTKIRIWVKFYPAQDRKNELNNDLNTNTFLVVAASDCQKSNWTYKCENWQRKPEKNHKNKLHLLYQKRSAHIQQKHTATMWKKWETGIENNKNVKNQKLKMFSKNSGVKLKRGDNHISKKFSHFKTFNFKKNS